jgi:hypothetical protein
LANNAITDRSFLWPQGIVPYEISPSFGTLNLHSEAPPIKYSDQLTKMLIFVASHELEIIIGSLTEIMDKTCIKFVPYTNQKDYLSFVRRSMGYSTPSRESEDTLNVALQLIQGQPQTSDPLKKPPFLHQAFLGYGEVAPSSPS